MTPTPDPPTAPAESAELEVDEPIVATVAELADVFEEWARRWEDDPDAFAEKVSSGSGYGDACSEYVVELLEELRAGQGPGS